MRRSTGKCGMVGRGGGMDFPPHFHDNRATVIKMAAPLLFISVIFLATTWVRVQWEGGLSGYTPYRDEQTRMYACLC